MHIDQPLTLLGGLTPAQFMKRHWQRKPLLVRGAVPGMQALVPAARLFELAARDDVESRLVVQDRGGWTLRQGPLARRAIPPAKQAGWTLLVQGMDLHDAGVHALLQGFRFVPEARLDDLMISHASDGGGVGPHFDSYDVFLLQAHGRRRWRIGRQKDLTLQPDVPLKILAHFEPEQEFVLEPGDMLYLPPRYAHDGIAEGECQTYSVGFRAPRQGQLARDLLSQLAEDAQDAVSDALYEDRGQPATATPGERTAAIARLSADELLPRLRRNGGAAQPLLRDTDCWLQADNGSLAVQLTTVTLVDLANPDLPQSTRCFAGGTEAVYLTPRNLWLATTRSTPLMESLSLVAAAPPRTDVHQFALDVTGTGGLAWRGSADVEGHLGWDSTRMSYRLSEHEGHLRVLTYTGNEGWASPADAGARRPSPARLTVLRADSAAASAYGRTLATVSVLPNARRPAAIGKPGEQVYAVRFVGARGYVVTFRRIDPLYVLDLADATDPRVVGEVELPGYAETLLPLPEGLLLGLGRAADAEGRVQGLQLTLFDVADATAPRVLRSLTLGEAGSASALEQSRHGLAMRLDAAPGGAVARLALPVVLSQGPFSGLQRGLQTFEVDTATRSLVLRDLKGATDGNGAGWLREERALLMGAQVVHLREGALAAYDW